MKIFIPIFYFFRSLLLRGFINTVRLIGAEKANEIKYGISTSSIKKSSSNEFFHYQGASYKVLFRIFNKIVAQTKELDFVDIGAGKGRAVFVAESFGYKNLTGIEMDKNLFSDSIENLKTYALKNKTSNILFVDANALDYNYKNKPTVYFLFNPFNDTVLKKVLNQISSSTIKETWFVYMNPKYSKVFTAEKFETVFEIKTKRYLEAIIYKLKSY